MTVSDRLHSLDAVRAYALLAGIALHAAMSFLPDFGSVGFPIIDNSPSVVLGLMFYVIHIFRMTLFFVIAGFFGHLLLQRRGLRPFIRDRFRRIGIPLVVGWFILIPLTFASVILALIQKPGGLAAAPPPPPPPADLILPFPLMHLWFLYILIGLYGTVLLMRACFSFIFDRNGNGRQVVDKGLKTLMESPWGPFILAVPLWIALCQMKEWGIWFGIPTPDNSLVPNAPAAFAYLIAFSLGWLVHRQPEILAIWKRRWRINLIFALAATAGALCIVGLKPVYLPQERSEMTMLYAANYTLAIWFWTFSSIGMGLQFCSHPSARLRYMADASYWLYLIHMPIIFTAQSIVMYWNLHWSVKFPLILGVTIPLMLLSYHYQVRYTFIGAVLNGRRHPRYSKCDIPIPDTSSEPAQALKAEPVLAEATSKPS